MALPPLRGPGATTQSSWYRVVGNGLPYPTPSSYSLPTATCLPSCDPRASPRPPSCDTGILERCAWGLDQFLRSTWRRRAQGWTLDSFLVAKRPANACLRAGCSVGPFYLLGQQSLRPRSSWSSPPNHSLSAWNRPPRQETRGRSDRCPIPCLWPRYSCVSGHLPTGGRQQRRKAPLACRG